MCVYVYTRSPGNARAATTVKQRVSSIIIYKGTNV